MDSIITKLTDELRKENVEDSKIDSIVHNLKSYWQYVGTIDLDNINYVTILKAIILAKFLKKKFDDNMGFSIMQKSLVYRDNDICIFKPTNFEESRIIGESICCFAYSQDRWDEHYIGNEEAIYYVYDVMRDDTQDFVAITVRPNGNARVLDKNHNWWTSSDSIKYIQTLGKGASLIVTKDGKPINTTIYNQETNENKIMNKKQVIRLNESQLKQIVTESVKRVLKETAGHLYYKDDEGNPHTNSKELYRGVKGAIFVYHGDWADPEILYKNHSINYWDAEQSLWYNYKEYCEENNIKPTDDGFEKYVNEYEDVASTLDELVWALDGNP